MAGPIHPFNPAAVANRSSRWVQGLPPPGWMKARNVIFSRAAYMPARSVAMRGCTDYFCSLAACFAAFFAAFCSFSHSLTMALASLRSSLVMILNGTFMT